MTEHLSTQLIERYQQRSLSPAELLEADDHFAACEACRQQLDETSSLQAAFTALDAELSPTGMESDHLSDEQIDAYLDDELDEVEREIVESHLNYCANCEAEMRDLRAFDAQMAAYPPKVYAPVAPPSLRQRLVAFSGLSSLREKIPSFWHSPVHSFPLQLAVTSVAAVMLGGVLLILTGSMRTKVVDLQARVNQLQQENAELQQNYQTAKTAAADLQAQLAQLRQTHSQQTPDSSSQVVLALNDSGRQVTLDKEGNFTGLESLPPSYQQVIKGALTAQRVTQPPMLADLIGKAGTLMGGAGDSVPFALLSPVGIVVQTTRPTLRWHPLNGVSGYIVTVFDANFNEVAASQSLSVTEWTVPHSLERGKLYSWQVVALKDGQEVLSPTPPVPKPKFRVLDQKKANELTRVRRTSADSHLTLGILYAQAGILDEAERELQALRQANPQSPVAQKLLGSVRAMRQPK